MKRIKSITGQPCARLKKKSSGFGTEIKDVIKRNIIKGCNLGFFWRDDHLLRLNEVLLIGRKTTTKRTSVAVNFFFDSKKNLNQKFFQRLKEPLFRREKIKYAEYHRLMPPDYSFTTL